MQWHVLALALVISSAVPQPNSQLTQVRVFHTTAFEPILVNFDDASLFREWLVVFIAELPSLTSFS